MFFLANFYSQDLIPAAPQPRQNEKPVATKISGKEILEAIRLMDAENWRAFCLHKRFTFAKQQKPQWGFWVTERSCASKMEGPCPDKWLFMQRKAGCANLAQKSPWFGQMCKRCAESVQPLSYIKKERQILRFDVQDMVHLQGLEPWAHWLREQAAGSSQFMEVSSHRYF